MTEIAEVVEISAEKAVVRVLSGEGCKTCAMQGNRALSTGGDWELEVVDTVGVEIGDKVRLELAGGSYIAAGALVFILPLILMALFYTLGEILFNGGTGVLMAFIGMIIGIGIAYVIGRGKGADRFRYRIVGILQKKTDVHNN